MRDEKAGMRCSPCIRRMYHDTPGVTGDSAQNIVFHPERHLAGVPYGASLGGEAEEWYHETGIMKEDKKRRLGKIPRKRVEKPKRGGYEPKEYEVGEWVW